MKIFYAISTHWDREWYLPFQQFRFKLVRETDKIIDALENNKLKTFTFDGQTIVLEDYLEIKPHMRERLFNLIKSGKLKVGPWYIMPDELSVSGESLIKNFLTGKKIASDFGSAPWNFGYINDIFGHIAQMPQILNGFGINAVYMGRGLGSIAQQKNKNFIWRAPDGSECFGYNERYGKLLEDFSKGDNKDEILENHIDASKDSGDAVILLYTADHVGIDENTFKFEEAVKKLEEKYEVFEGLENISKALEDKKDLLPKETGELITTGEAEGIFRAVTHSISSYYPLKRENDLCENIIENYLAPYTVMARCKNIETDSNFYHLAAKYLLKNQPHDNICGCSCERVHEDMAYRYSQVKSILDAVYENLKKNLSEKSDKGYFISVLNSNIKVQDGVFITDIYFDKTWSNTVTDNAKYQSFCQFSIKDEKGNIVPYQILDIEKNVMDFTSPYEDAKERYRIAVYSKLKPFGETIFEIVPKKPEAYINDLSDSELKAENEYIKIEISNDGSLTLYDKESGETYDGLNTFTDDGEIGNGWFSERPMAYNSAVSSKGAETSIEIIRRGELISEFKVKKTLTVPTHTDYNTLKRADDEAKLKISTNIILKKGSRAVEIETTVENNIKDHRLRLHIPTGVEGDDYYSSQAFAFVKRNRGVSKEGANYFEPEAYEKNTSGIISLSSGTRTLSFISKEGIHEAGVSNSGVISATMLRTFGRLMHDNFQNPKAQLLGTHKFRYAITAEKDFSKLSDMKKSLFETVPSFPVCSKKSSFGLLELKGEVNASIIKPAEDDKGFIIRLFNTKETAEKCSILFNTEVKKVYKATLAEDKISEYNLSEKTLNLEILSNKIETIYAEF